MSLSKYVLAYLKTNYFTACLIGFLLAILLLRHIKKPRLSSRAWLILIVFLGLALRIGWIYSSSYTPQASWNPQHMLESDVANVHAIELTKGIWFHDAEGKPSARRPIGYPVLVALAYKLFGVNIAVAYALNLALFAAAAVCLYLIGRLVFSQRAGLLASFFFSIFPISIYSINMITDEHLFVPLWFFGLYMLLREIHGRRVRGALIWYGLIFGYAAMTRPNVIFMPFVVAFAYALLKYNWKKVLTSFALVLLLMQGLNLPWLIRNYNIWGVYLPYTASTAYIYSRVNSNATPEGAGRIPEKGEPGYSEELEQAALAKNEGLYDVLCQRLMRRWILEHPLEFLDLGSKRFLHFMCWNRTGVWPIWFQYYDGSFDPSRPLHPALRNFYEESSYIFYYILFFTFLIGVVFLICRWKEAGEAQRKSVWVLFSCFAFWCAEHMIIYPDRKYRFPLEVMMILAACHFLSFWIWDFRRPALFFKRR